MVTVWPTPNGLPMASTTSPIAQRSDLPRVMAGRFLSVDLEHGEIGLGIAADDLGGGVAAVAQEYLDGIGTADNVVIGEDVTLIAEDHATSQAAFDALARRILPAPEELLEDWIPEQRIWLNSHDLGGVDVDHRRCGFFHCRGVRHRTACRLRGLFGRFTHFHRCRLAPQQARPEQSQQEGERQAHSDGLRDKYDQFTGVHDGLFWQERGGDCSADREICRNLRQKSHTLLTARGRIDDAMPPFL